MATAANDDRPVRTIDDLLEPLISALKPESEYRIGAEAEKVGLAFPLDGGAPRPLPYETRDPHQPSVRLVLEQLAEKHGWHRDEAGPLIALEKDGASVTLEPGAQLELSGAPLDDVHAIENEVRAHLSELHDISASLRDRMALDLVWLGIGFHPTAKHDDLTWVPKARYGIMKTYLPTKGTHGLDMMRRTATVQANFDYKSEEDAMKKLRVGLRVAPFFTAMFANSPYYEGSLFGGKSYRAKVWLSVDPDRQGLVPRVIDKPDAGFVDYVEWVLDAPMFLILRGIPASSTPLVGMTGGQRVVENTGQTFRQFMRDGFDGEHATMSDWTTHLNTMFPEVRLKRTLEVRGADSLPADLVSAPAALFTGLFYDARALDEADELSSSFTFAELEALRPAVVERALLAPFKGKKAVDVAARLVDIARGGLERRARLDSDGRDERIHLEALAALVGAARCPADRLLDAAGAAGLRARLAPVEL